MTAAARPVKGESRFLGGEHHFRSCCLLIRPTLRAAASESCRAVTYGSTLCVLCPMDAQSAGHDGCFRPRSGNAGPRLGPSRDPCCSRSPLGVSIGSRRRYDSAAWRSAGSSARKETLSLTRCQRRDPIRDPVCSLCGWPYRTGTARLKRGSQRRSTRFGEDATRQAGNSSAVRRSPSRPILFCLKVRSWVAVVGGLGAGMWERRCGTTLAAPSPDRRPGSPSVPIRSYPYLTFDNSFASIRPPTAAPPARIQGRASKVLEFA
jgi:hypothetical protein